MPAKKKTTKRAKKTATPLSPLQQVQARGQEAGRGLRQTWDSALAALTQAEADVAKQVRRLMKRNRIDASDASSLLESLNAGLERGRQAAARGLETRAQEVQARLAKERKNLSRAVDDAVQNALATFNIPSRKELAELTRKVEQLTRKVDALR
jgi:polyhydroxyalkanoate synthesis regulator phasin